MTTIPEGLHKTDHCPILSTLAWFATAGQFDGKSLDVRQAAFYTGMQIEELGEKLAAFLGASHSLLHRLGELADEFKRGDHDTAVEFAMRTQAAEVLDGDIDLVWVSIGAAGAQGADVRGAYRAVSAANWAKFPGGVVTRHPGTGKVIKPAGWTPPDLTRFTHFGRR